MVKLIANNFSAILGKKLLKISKVSKETGISRTTLTNLYYRRSTCVSLEVLDKLCQYLNCGVGDLFEYEQKAASPDETPNPVLQPTNSGKRN